jgi:hypothetical protein
MGFVRSMLMSIPISRFNRGGLIALAVLYLVGFSAPMAEADPITYITPTGSTTADGAVSATASITLGNGFFTVVLTNLGQNPTADGQEISAFIIDVKGTTGSLTTSNSGETTTISSNGSYTAGVASTLTKWKATGSTNSVELNVLTGGKPNELIIGPDSKGNLDPTLGGLYSNANPSITGHEPSVLGTATFTVTDASITTSSSVTGAIFQFGTTAGQDQVDGSLQQGVQPAVVPEPATIIMTGLGLGAFGLVRILRKARKA